jgi:hypothetical protein
MVKIGKLWLGLAVATYVATGVASGAFAQGAQNLSPDAKTLVATVPQGEIKPACAAGRDGVLKMVRQTFSDLQKERRGSLSQSVVPEAVAYFMTTGCKEAK